MRLLQRKRRDLYKSPSLFKPNACTSLRVLLDRAVKGLPVNARMSEHVPLPPDGDDLEDYDKGTDEILDLVDAQVVSERYEQYKAELEKKQEEERKKLLDEDFQRKVDEEIARRAAAQQS